MEVHQHVLLQVSLSVVDGNRVVMSVQAMDEGLNGRFVKMSQIRSCLTRLLSKHQRLRVDEPEGVNDDFTLNGLDGIDDDGNSAWGKLLEGLLGVDIDTG